MGCLTNIAYVFAGLALSPMVLYRMLRHHRYREGWSERKGYVRRRSDSRRCVWIHAVSVGEVNATRTIVQMLQERDPDIEICISATTDTGIARARSLYANELSVFYFPFDFTTCMKRAFDNLRPSVCVLMELEVWPNFMEIAVARHIPVIVANGRISERGIKRYRIVKKLVRSTFEKIDHALVQTQEYAERFIELGCKPENVKVVGSVKYDTAQTKNVAGADDLRAKLSLEQRKLWVAGGTGNDEEVILLDVFKKLQSEKDFDDLRFAIVPRKPERFHEVAAAIKHAGFALQRYSEIKNSGQNMPEWDKNLVLLGDTMGDLRTFYAISDFIFVGRSLVPMGGSDMIEASALKKCTMFGPYTFNFKQTVDALLKGNGAIEVQNGEKLFEQMCLCLRDRQKKETTAANGQKVVLENQGATQQTVEAITKLLPDQ